MNLDWALVEVFLNVYETGSLTAASVKMDASQPTIGRQVRQLEKLLAQALFSRYAKGLKPTPFAEQIYPLACEMRISMGRIATLAAGHQDQMNGTVRITASEMVGHFVLPNVLANIRSEYPKIELELYLNDKTESLAFNEVDIAIRMFQPEKGELVARKIGELATAICASKQYIEQKGIPSTPQELFEHDLIGYNRNDLILRYIQQLGYSVSRNNFSIRCDDQPASWHLIKAGCGIGFVPKVLAQKHNDIEIILPEIPMPRLPVFMVGTDIVKYDKRIKVVWESLGKKLSKAFTEM